MLGFSFSEILLIAVVGIVVIGPKDLPVVIRHVAKFLHELRSLYDGLKGHMNDLVKEAGMDDLHRDLQRDMTTIIDLEGKPQQAFDVKELEGLSASTGGAIRGVAPSPLAGDFEREQGRLNVSLIPVEGDEGALKQSASSSSPLTQPSPARGEGSAEAPYLPKGSA